MNLLIRDELPGDVNAIAHLTEAAFANAPHTSHTEHFIVAALRKAGQLSISLVALEGDDLVGHVALSPVALSSGDAGWHGLGPISVRPDRQGRGIGSALMVEAIERLKAMGSAGCVLLGDPVYYARFGFKPGEPLVLPGVPAEYFQALPLSDVVPHAEVRYHAAFEANA
ncbi:MAG: N-acetyltransferase [Stenotrophomonas sp.]